MKNKKNNTAEWKKNAYLIVSQFSKRGLTLLKQALLQKYRKKFQIFVASSYYPMLTNETVLLKQSQELYW